MPLNFFLKEHLSVCVNFILESPSDGVILNLSVLTHDHHGIHHNDGQNLVQGIHEATLKICFDKSHKAKKWFAHLNLIPINAFVQLSMKILLKSV